MAKLRLGCEEIGQFRVESKIQKDMRSLESFKSRVKETQFCSTANTSWHSLGSSEKFHCNQMMRIPRIVTLRISKKILGVWVNIVKSWLSAMMDDRIHKITLNSIVAFALYEVGVCTWLLHLGIYRCQSIFMESFKWINVKSIELFIL